MFKKTFLTALGVLALACAVSAQETEIPVEPREPVAAPAALDPSPFTVGTLRAQFIILDGPDGNPSFVMDGGAQTRRPQILLFRKDRSLALSIELVRDRPRIERYRKGKHLYGEVMANYAARR